MTVCNADPLLSLISQHNLDNNGIGTDTSGGSSSQDDKSINSEGRYTTPTHRTALDDMRQIASLCSTYKTRAIVNNNEFRYKRAKLKERQRQEKSNNTESTDAFKSTQSPPPYHSEYTHLALAENFLLAKIHGANYNLCLAKATCPDRTSRLLKCWKSVDPQLLKMMEQEGMEDFICMQEREAVERCIGLGVQRVMKDILG